jgi:SAM-dependent methyltransferase
MIASHGWLSRSSYRGPIEGVEFDYTLPTRNEEYALVAEVFRDLPFGYRVLDAGTGFIPNWHVAPYILSALDCEVKALDLNPAHLSMPEDPYVDRFVGDITDTQLDDHSCDAVICISVLEHCTPDVRSAFVAEAHRVLRPGGLLLITADELDPAAYGPLLAGFDIGELVPFEGEHLSPRVSFALARRNAER